MISKPKMNLERWYGGSLSIPRYSHPGFGSFVASCLGIVRHILDRYAGVNVRVSFSHIGTGAMDIKNGIIFINKNYLIGDAPEISNERLEAVDAITLILGLTAHESAHYAWSPETMKEGIEYIKSHCLANYDERVAAAVTNLTEDIWIEAELDRKTPSITWMVEGMNSLYFSHRISDGRWEEAKEIVAPPPTIEWVGNLLNVLVLAKVRESLVEVTLDENPYIDSLFNLTHSAVDCTQDKETRFLLATELYDRLMENVPESECKGGSGGEAMKEALSEIVGVAGSYEEGKDEKEGGESVKLGALLVKVLEEIDRMSRYHISSDVDDFEEGHVVYLEKTMEPSSSSVELDDKYLPLAELARQRASTNKPYGQDRTKGHTMRKLYRIGTDNKIFAERVRMHDYKPLEVVVLVDCSGSMGGTNSNGETRISLALKAALGAANGLSHGRSRVAVYGHTADVHDKEVMIYNIKGFDDPIDNVGHRLKTVLNNRRSQNKDGFAIRYVAGKFRTKTAKRLLIVISDGDPAAPGYSGEKAIEHTQQCVEEAKARGIRVLSISITKGANKTNNYIYGSRNNVYNEDPNVILEIVQSLFE